MWIEGPKLQQIGSALETGQRPDIDRLLREILSGAAAGQPMPGGCAVCRRDLVRTEAACGLVIYRCPAEHGAWLGPEARAALEAFIAARPRPSSNRRLKILLGVLTVSVVALVAVLVALPTLQPVIPPDSMPPDEALYVIQLGAVLDEGISNRTSVDRALKGSGTPDGYQRAFATYEERQRAVLARLRTLAVPGRLGPVHARIVTAAEHQIAFYRAFAEARARGTVADMTQLLGHPDLRESDYQLHAAWDAFRAIYPGLDKSFSDSIESRLCWFDVI